MCCDNRVPLSVIMGTLYRREDISLLKRSVESILKQTFSNFEFIICDTGSTEKAITYLENLDDPRVKLARNSCSLDLASKLNLCLSIARGKYIARMDDDDWSCPKRFEKELNYLENVDLGFVGSNVSLIQNGKKVGQRVFPERPTVEDFYINQPYIHPTLIFRREALEAVGGYCVSKDCILCEDYDLLLRLYKAGYWGANIQENLLDYTISSNPNGGRTMGHRVNEVRIRYRRFKELGRLPQAIPYVVKPILVGVLPGTVLEILKRKQWDHG